MVAATYAALRTSTTFLTPRNTISRVLNYDCCDRLTLDLVNVGDVLNTRATGVVDLLVGELLRIGVT